MGKIKKAVIPAAGLGTRFLPASKVVPKELFTIVDKPCIQYIVEEGIAAGIEEFIFVLSRDKMAVLDHFRPHPELEEHLRQKNKSDFSITSLQNKAKFSCVFQDKPLGLGHAVLCAKDAVGSDDFFVFLPDDLIDHEVPCAVQMLKVWENHPSALVAVMEVPWNKVSSYGVVKALPISASLGKVESVIEKPKREEAPSNLAIIGRYLLPAKIFSFLEQTKPGAVGEIQLTDALLKLVQEEELIALQFEGERFDVGTPLGFVEANVNYAWKRDDLKNSIVEYIKILAESR